MFRRFHFSSAGLESANAAHERYSKLSDEHERCWISPDVRCISLRFQIINTPAKSKNQHLQSPRINARQPTRPKPYNTNHCEEEGPTWPFAPAQAVHNSGLVRARTIYAKKDSIMRYTKIRKMFATTCEVHTPP